MIKLKNIIKLIIGFPIYWISKALPKNSNLEIIGSSIGNHFADNPKYYFIQHYKSDNPKTKLVWLTKSKKVVKEIEDINLPVAHLYSVVGITMALRASKSYISHQLDDINGALIGGSIIIQLWHGMPIKKIGFGGDWNDDGTIGKLKVLAFKLFPYFYYMSCDILIAPCQKAKENYIESFSKSFRNNKTEENIILTCQPRTLYFNKNLNMEESFFPEIKFLLSINEKYDKIISWLPTQRLQLNKSILDVIQESKLDMKKLEQFCKEKNFLFVIKVHFLDFEKVKDITEDFENILVYIYSDPYPLLKYTDVLITDYSSVFFDFLLLNRPIIFMCYDIKEYSKKVEFYYDLNSLNIGNIYQKWDQVIQNLDSKDQFTYNRSFLFKKFKFVNDYNLREKVESNLIKYKP